MDLLNSAASEKLALPDFNYATQYVPMAAQWELGGSFILPPSQGCIVSGFAPAYLSAQNAVTVNATTDGSTPSGTAFLGYMDASGQVRYGMLMPRNNSQTATQSLAGLNPGGSYKAYIRFNYVPAAPQNRAYEAKPNSPAEYAQLTYTRLQAIWELRVELASITMSAEWLPIANIVIGQGSTPTTLADTRVLYFEGSPANNYAPNWGTTADRAAVRANPATGAAKITDLRSELDAIRQCLVDIKGPGLQPWQSSCIGGMNMGAAFAASPSTGLAQTAPIDATLALGDMGFLVMGVSAISGDNGPKISFNAQTTGGSLFYNRAANLLTYNYGAPGVAPTAYVGISSAGYLGLGNAATAPANRLHVAANGMQPARFDAGNTSAGQCYVYLNGYGTGDKVVYAIGDGLGGTSAQRWGMGQLSAGIFGFQNAQTAANFYTYNPGSTNTVSSFAYTRTSTNQANSVLAGSYAYAPTTVSGQHSYAGYLFVPNGATINGQIVGNFIAANVVAVNGSSGGQRQPGFVMGTQTTMLGYTSLNTQVETSPDMWPLFIGRIIPNGSGNASTIAVSAGPLAGSVSSLGASNNVHTDILRFSANLPGNVVCHITPSVRTSDLQNNQTNPETSAPNWYEASFIQSGNDLVIIIATPNAISSTCPYCITIYALGV